MKAVYHLFPLGGRKEICVIFELTQTLQATRSTEQTLAKSKQTVFNLIQLPLQYDKTNSTGIYKQLEY